MRQRYVGRPFWIDGLCINQEDPTERNHQVAEMGRIYSCASFVTIWLGEATPDVEDAYELISGYQTWSQVDNHRIVEHVRSDKVGAIALTRLLRRPYWQRMWVFQEIVLAKYALVHCGNFQTHWNNFSVMDRVMADQRLWAHVPMKESHIHDLRRAFFGISQFCIQREQSTDINNVLYPTRSLRCADPRDKLYALMGVCEVSESLKLYPDYTRSVRHVYTDFTRCLIEKEEDLSSILTAGLWNPRNGTDICLPTWVPDYRGTHGVSTRYLAASYLGHFDATKGRDGFYLFPADNEGEHTRLKVRGLLFDTIKNNVTFEKGKEILQVIEALFDVEFPPLHGPLQSDEVPLDPIFRTMIFEDPTLSPQSNPDRLARLALGFAYDLLVMAASTPLPAAPSFKRLVNRFLSSFQATLQSRPQESLSEVYARLMEEDDEQLYWYREEYLARSRESSQGSTPSFFSTHGGRIGKGLETAEPGDRVAVIYSCRIPVVIRPHGEFYQLVGPCFVNGAMNGEAVENFGSIPGEEQDIILV